MYESGTEEFAARFNAYSTTPAFGNTILSWL